MTDPLWQTKSKYLAPITNYRKSLTCKWNTFQKLIYKEKYIDLWKFPKDKIL